MASDSPSRSVRLAITTFKRSCDARAMAVSRSFLEPAAEVRMRSSFLMRAPGWMSSGWLVYPIWTKAPPGARHPNPASHRLPGSDSLEEHVRRPSQHPARLLRKGLVAVRIVDHQAGPGTEALRQIQLGRVIRHRQHGGARQRRHLDKHQPDASDSVDHHRIADPDSGQPYRMDGGHAAAGQHRARLGRNCLRQGDEVPLRDGHVLGEPAVGGEPDHPTGTFAQPVPVGVAIPARTAVHHVVDRHPQAW